MAPADRSTAPVTKGRERLLALSKQTDQLEKQYRKAIAERDSLVNKLISQGARYTDLAKDIGVTEGAVRAIARRKADAPPAPRRQRRA